LDYYSVSFGYPLYPWQKSPGYPLDIRLGRPPEPVWTVLTSEDSVPYQAQIVQLVANLYTYCTATKIIKKIKYDTIK
jgi:hypothetical protein